MTHGFSLERREEQAEDKSLRDAKATARMQRRGEPVTRSDSRTSGRDGGESGESAGQQDRGATKEAADGQAGDAPSAQKRRRGDVEEGAGPKATVLLSHSSDKDTATSDVTTAPGMDTKPDSAAAMQSPLSSSNTKPVSGQFSSDEAIRSSSSSSNTTRGKPQPTTGSMLQDGPATTTSGGTAGDPQSKQTSPQQAPVASTSTATSTPTPTAASSTTPTQAAGAAATTAVDATAAAVARHTSVVSNTSSASTPQAPNIWGAQQSATTPSASQHEGGYYPNSYYHGRVYEQSPYAYYGAGDYADTSSYDYAQWYSPDYAQQQQPQDPNWTDAYYYGGGYQDQQAHYPQGYLQYTPQQQQQQQYSPYTQQEQQYPQYAPHQQQYSQFTPYVQQREEREEREHLHPHRPQQEVQGQGLQPPSKPEQEATRATPAGQAWDKSETLPGRRNSTHSAEPAQQNPEDNASSPHGKKESADTPTERPQAASRVIELDTDDDEGHHAAATDRVTASSDIATGAAASQGQSSRAATSGEAQRGVCSPPSSIANGATSERGESAQVVVESPAAAARQMNAGAAGLSLLPLLWTGLLQLKQRRFAIELRFLAGGMALTRATLPSESAVIRIGKRAPLSNTTQAMLRKVVTDPQQSCVCLGRAKDPMHRAAFVAFTGMYLRRKDSAGFVNSGRGQLYVLPPCSFARECLQRAAPLADASSALESDILFVMCFSQGS